MRTTLWLGLFLTSLASGASLTLDAYLKQVKEGNDGVKAAIETSEGAKLRQGEAGLLTSPQIFANLQYLNDAKPTSNPSFQGTRTLHSDYSLGVAQPFSFGLTSRLYYNFSFTELEGVNRAFVPQPKFHEARPVLEVSQSLWRNGFGSETRATSKLADAGAQATSLSETFKLKALLAQAEGTFWRLAIAREMVQVQKESLDRAKRLKEWTQRRVKLGLADISDDLQSEAGVQLRLLEYQSALDEQRVAEDEFNSLRGNNLKTVAETLPPVNRETTAGLKSMEKKGPREDVQAAQKMAEVAAANAELGLEKNRPTLDVSGSVALNGRNDELSGAMTDSLKTQTPTFAVGVKFVAPLAFGTTAADREGYAREVKGAELNLKRKQFEDQRQWDDLQKKFEESNGRLKLSFALEDAQQKKLERERSRLKLGRSVTYQVLQFEQDYATAQMLRLKTQGEVLGLHTQLKTFGDVQ